MRLTILKSSIALPKVFYRGIRTSAILSDYYSVLGASRNDSKKDLKKKFRKLAKEHHPDTSDSGDTLKFQEVNEAWEVLKDDDKRKMYDQLGHEGYKMHQERGGGNYNPNSQGNPYNGMDLNDLFSDLFGGGRGSQRRRQRGRQRVPGNDLNVGLELSFEEAVNGTTKSFSYYRMDKCTDCKGSGVHNNEQANETVCSDCKGQGIRTRMVGNNMFTQETCQTCLGIGTKLNNGCKSCTATGQVRKQTQVNDFVIPPGVDTGTIFQKPNSGDVGLFGGEYGDLLLQVSVKPDRTGRFSRNGLDLHTTVEVDFVKSLLGGKHEIKSVTGEVMDVKIIPGTLHGALLKLSLRGVKYGARKGDMFIRVNVKPVKNLTPRQIELLEEFDIEENNKKRNLEKEEGS